MKRPLVTSSVLILLDHVPSELIHAAFGGGSSRVGWQRQLRAAAAAVENRGWISVVLQVSNEPGSRASGRLFAITFVQTITEGGRIASPSSPSHPTHIAQYVPNVVDVGSPRLLCRHLQDCAPSWVAVLLLLYRHTHL